MDDIFVRLTDLPCRIYGTTVLDDNGDYNVYLNAHCSYEMQMQSLKHELSHIGKGHFYDGLPLLLDEAEAVAGESECIDPQIIRDVHQLGSV